MEQQDNVQQEEGIESQTPITSEGEDNPLLLNPADLGASMQDVQLTGVETGPKKEPSPKEKEEEALYNASGPYDEASLTQRALTYVDRTFFNNVLTPELMKDAERELEALTDDELERLWTEESIPKEIADKIPNYMKAKRIQDGEGWNQQYIIPTLSFVPDLVQAGSVGAVKGALEMPVAAVDVLNWVDDATGLDAIPNDAVAELDDASNQWQKELDKAVPDGLFASLASTGLQNAVGMAAFGFVSGGTSWWVRGGRKLLQSALASATAFGIHGENAANALVKHLDNYPTLQEALSYMAVNKTDTVPEAVLKNMAASGVTDITMGLIMKALGKLGRALFGRRSAKNIADGADEAATGGAVKGKTTSTIVDSADDASVKKSVVDGVTDGTDEASGRAVLDIDPETLNGKEVSEAIEEFNDVMDKVSKELSDNTPNGKTSPTPSVADTVPQATKAVQSDAEALLERAQKLMADTDLDTDFHPTHDVINPKIVKGFTEDEGIERLLQLGNDVPDVNSLGRDASQFTVQRSSEVLSQARDALEDVENLKVELGELAQMSEKLPMAIVSSRQLLADHTRILGGLVQKLNRMDIGSLERQVLIDEELTQALLNTAKISSFFDTLSTNVARGLKAHQYGMVDSLKQIAPDSSWLKGDVYQNFASKISQMSVSEKVATARYLADAATPRQARRFLENFAKGTWKKGMDISAELFYNSILSGAKTGMRNILGNALNQFVVMPLDNIARGLLFHNREAWNDGWKAFWAIQQSLGEALKVTWKSMRQGVYTMGLDNGILVPQQRAISAINMGADPDGVLGRFLNILGVSINLPTRYLQRTDQFFQQLAARSNVRTYLWTEAEKLFSQGMAPQGMRKTDFILDYVSKHFDEYFMDAADSVGHVIKGSNLNKELGGRVIERALDAAKRATFAQDLKKGSLSHHLSQAVRDNPALRLVVPFIKVPTNILSEGVAHTPLPAFLPSFWKDVRAGGVAREIAVSKLTVGSLFCATAASMAYCGKITGAAPQNARVRDSLYSAGWRPYSFKLEDTWISYEGWEPISTIFGLIADFTQIYKGESGEMDFHNNIEENSEFTQAVMGVLGAVSQNLVNKSYMSGLSQALDIISSDDPNRMLNAMKGFAGVLVPNIATTIRKAIDPSVREVRGVLDSLKNKIPLWNETLPMKYDWLTGEPVHYMGERVSGISPFVYHTVEGSTEQRALSQIAGLIPSPSRRVNNNTLTGQQYSDYCRLHGSLKLGGKTLKQALAKELERYKDLPDDELKVKLTEMTLKYRDAAKKELMKLYPELKVNPNKKTPVSPSLSLPWQTTSPANGNGGETVAKFM